MLLFSHSTLRHICKVHNVYYSQYSLLLCVILFLLVQPQQFSMAINSAQSAASCTRPMQNMLSIQLRRTNQIVCGIFQFETYMPDSELVFVGFENWISENSIDCLRSNEHGIRILIWKRTLHCNWLMSSISSLFNDLVIIWAVEIDRWNDHFRFIGQLYRPPSAHLAAA